MQECEYNWVRIGEITERQGSKEIEKRRDRRDRERDLETDTHRERKIVYEDPISFFITHLKNWYNTFRLDRLCADQNVVTPSD